MRFGSALAVAGATPASSGAPFAFFAPVEAASTLRFGRPGPASRPTSLSELVARLTRRIARGCTFGLAEASAVAVRRASLGTAGVAASIAAADSTTARASASSIDAPTTRACPRAVALVARAAASNVFCGPADAPSHEGRRRYAATSGYYRRDAADACTRPCACAAACELPCDGGCGCAGCRMRAFDARVARAHAASVEAAVREGRARSPSCVAGVPTESSHRVHEFRV